ncbi:pectinesterase 3 [Salvia miltiorrhiza]|uniref:pectinesterase 3 n=1 Tax=Salvia miltiorrhiza TaxID=226208 RepID=UPI0025ABE092|nr:pectinesterase 3 [Salvia miltiorrhiza]
MELINFAKGYGKVNPAEAEDNPPDSPPNHQRRRIIAFSLAVFLTLTITITSLITVLIHESAAESEPSQLASNSADPLKTVCSVTRYPNSCFSSISPLNSPPSNNPLQFFNLSLHASLLEVSSLKSQLPEPNTEPAMKDCAELFDGAASQLGRSAELICVGPGEEVLTEMRISDLQTWISAALTDLDTCLDGLAEMGSTAVGEWKLKVQKAKEYISNTLAILTNIRSLSQKFGLAMP